MYGENGGCGQGHCWEARVRVVSGRYWGTGGTGALGARGSRRMRVSRRQMRVRRREMMHVQEAGEHKA